MKLNHRRWIPNNFSFRCRTRNLGLHARVSRLSGILPAGNRSEPSEPGSHAAYPACPPLARLRQAWRQAGASARAAGARGQNFYMVFIDLSSQDSYNRFIAMKLRTIFTGNTVLVAWFLTDALAVRSCV